MYTILNKDHGIVKFLADSDKDLVTIVDACLPGSTVEVVEKPEEGKAKTHTFIKSPMGQWTLYKGESSFKLPKNDAKVTEPDPEEFMQGTTKKIKEYQKGIKIYQTGLVTGTLMDATVSEDTGYPKDQCTGHYFTAKLVTPQNAQQYQIYTEDTARGEPVKPCDGVLTVRMENMNAPTETGKNIKVVYDTGEEFEFNLSQLTLE